jgi:FkbM family methyltransferase
MLIDNPRLRRSLKTVGLYRAAQTVYAELQKPKRLKFYSQFVKEGSLCFDIGANFGSRVGVFLELGANVVAVEPQSECATYMLHKYSSNPRVKIVNAAVGEHRGVAEIKICTSSDAWTSMSDEYINHVSQKKEMVGYRWDRTEKVAVTTLDELVEEFGTPDFCKIDVEGFELQVINRLSSTLPVLSFEHTLGMMEPTLKVMAKLDSLGDYRYNHSAGESMSLVSEEWGSSKEELDSLQRADSTVDIYARVF